MAKRELQEINAGSMADIAFLLLVFFLVTTTVEMEAGISRVLPLKRELPPDIELPEVNKRNILEIQVNSQNQLRVENAPLIMEDLEQKVLDFYTVNKGSEVDPNMPKYETVTLAECNTNIEKLTESLEKAKDSEKQFVQDELNKWESRKKVCAISPGGTFQEINKSAVIQLKNQAGTSYGTYMEIQDVLKKVVTNLRIEEAQNLGWEYDQLDEDNPEDQEKIEILRVLVPERIVEAKIER